MQKVIIESPFAGDVEANLIYLEQCIYDSLMRGEAPIASHYIYPAVLDDNNPEERKLGIEAGFAWWGPGVKVVFYLDRGMSKGMAAAAARCAAMGITPEHRYLFH